MDGIYVLIIFIPCFSAMIDTHGDLHSPILIGRYAAGMLEWRRPVALVSQHWGLEGGMEGQNGMRRVVQDPEGHGISSSGTHQYPNCLSGLDPLTH